MGINPLVPRVQKIKISNLALNWLLIIEFVKRMVYLGAHYSERQGLIGINDIDNLKNSKNCIALCDLK